MPWSECPGKLAISELLQSRIILRKIIAAARLQAQVQDKDIFYQKGEGKEQPSLAQKYKKGRKGKVAMWSGEKNV